MILLKEGELPVLVHSLTIIFVAQPAKIPAVEIVSAIERSIAGFMINPFGC